MQWYYAINGQRQGPVTESEFEQLVRNGTVRSDTPVWRQGMAGWQTYGEIAPTAPVSAASEPLNPAPESTIAPSGALAGQDDTAVCVVSGKRYPKREMVHYEGNWISAEHRDAYFQRIREGERVVGEHVFAGFWIRFVAKIIDIIITMVVIFTIAFVVGYSLFSQPTIEDPADVWAALAVQGLISLLQIAFTLGYSWFFLSRFAATPGKMALGLKVIRPDGQKLTTGRIIGRFFAEMLSGMILYIGYIMAAFDEEKRALHDQICDTRVIKTR